MKNSIPCLATLLAILALQSGCFSIGPGRKAPVPRYALQIERIEPKAFSDHSETNALFVIGRMKSSRLTEGESISITDVKDGRFGLFKGGKLAFPVEVVVETATRTWLSRSAKFGTVVSSSIAPRSKRRTILEGWIERFGLERDEGRWTARIEIRYILQLPDGNFREIPLSEKTSVDTPIRDNAPKPEDVMRAFRRGLEAILENLEKELEDDDD